VATSFFLDCLTYVHLVNEQSVDFDELLTAAVSCHLQFSDLVWLQQWSLWSNSLVPFPQILMEACHIHTPLVYAAWKCLLMSYPCREMAQFFLGGIVYGFRVGFNSQIVHLKSASRNMLSSMSHPDVVDAYLLNEIQEGRVVGPFASNMLSSVHISRFGVIPKSGQQNKWRLIIDLCSMKYMTVDDAIRKILAYGPGSLLAKIDIKSAFRLLPVHPLDRHLLAMEWRGQVYVDMCLPFGLKSAP
jgi:hypothetical protein